MIVIAHDTKVVETFADTKEKVFGQTLHVEPNVEAAFAEFVAFSRIRRSQTSLAPIVGRCFPRSGVRNFLPANP